MIYYAQNNANRPNNQGGVTDQTVATTNYYNATDSATLSSAMANIFNAIAETLGIGEVSIQDGTTNQVETSSGEISSLLEVDENSFEYWMEFPVTDNKINRVDPLSGEEYTISLSKNNETGKIIATSNKWGDGVQVEVDGELGIGTFKYKWVEANNLYNYNPPAATYDKYDAETNPTGTGKVDWKLGKVVENGVTVQEGVGTLLDGVTYTVTFDVYPSQTTYDTVAEIKNSDNPQATYNDLDENIKKYLKYEDGSFTLETNTKATLTYTDTREENPTPVTKTYKNPDPVITEASELNVEKVWLNELDKKSAPDSLVLNMNLIKDGNETGLTVTVQKDNNWQEDVTIATGLMKWKQFTQ